MENLIKKMNLNNEYQVIMSNDLIKAKSNLALNELKLLRLTIMQIVKEDTEFMTYKIKIKELSTLLKIDNHDIYRDIYKICKNLVKETIEISDGNPKHKWKIFSWCSSCSYAKGIVTIRLHDDLKPYLLNLSKLYTQYLLNDVLCLKSVHSIRLYELIREEMKYQKVYADKEANIYLSVQLIRQVTNTDSKYMQYGMFKKRVIEPAIKEINDKLEYFITYEPVKESKKIVGFNINIKSKIANELSEEKKKEINQRIDKKIIKM